MAAQKMREPLLKSRIGWAENMAEALISPAICDESIERDLRNRSTTIPSTNEYLAKMAPN
jgi:hypothetical protein